MLPEEKSSPLQMLEQTQKELEMFKEVLLGGKAADYAEKIEDIAHKLAAVRDQLNRQKQDKVEFLMDLSRELRTPLNGLIGTGDLIELTPLNEEQKEYLKMMKASTKALVDTVNDVLNLTRLEAGLIALNYVEMDVLRLIEGCAVMAAELAGERNLALMTYVAPEIPKLVVSDPVRIRQVLLHLLSNAITSTESGEVIVRADLLAWDGIHSALKFSISDSSGGIDELSREVLFKPFAKSESAQFEKYQGSGLQLAICKAAVEGMRGQIGVEVNEGKGCTFWFVVPLEEQLSALNSEVPELDLGKLRMLVAGRSAGACRILESYANSWGIPCDMVNDGIQTYKALRDFQEKGTPYDLVLVEYQLPDTDVINLVRMIRQNNEMNSVIFILYNASENENLKRDAKLAGYAACLSGPLTQSDVLDCFASVLCGPKTVVRTVSTAQPGLETLEAEQHPFVVPGKLVMVVEDNPLNQRIIMLELEELGIASCAASNGMEALKIVETKPVSLILMDCRMPVMDGYETTRQMRELEKKLGCHIPIVALTAQAMPDDRQRCLESGMDDYLSKPVDLEELKFLLDKWLPAKEPA